MTIFQPGNLVCSIDIGRLWTNAFSDPDVIDDSSAVISLALRRKGKINRPAVLRYKASRGPGYGKRINFVHPNILCTVIDTSHPRMILVLTNKLELGWAWRENFTNHEQ